MSGHPGGTAGAGHGLPGERGDKRASRLEAHPTKALRGTGVEMQKGVAAIFLILSYLRYNPRSKNERGLSYKRLWFRELTATLKRRFRSREEGMGVRKRPRPGGDEVFYEDAEAAATGPIPAPGAPGGLLR